MRIRKQPHALSTRKAQEHALNIGRARGALKHFDYIEEKTQNGVKLRTGVVCKCCGCQLIGSSVIDDMTETNRQNNHTTTTKFMTTIATAAYCVATIELKTTEQNGNVRTAKLQTPLCRECAMSPTTDWQAVYDADIERLRIMGMDITQLVGMTFVRVIEIEDA